MELKTYFCQDRSGNTISGATTTIYIYGTNTLATGLLNPDGTGLANPFTTDANGRVSFKAPDGSYEMQFVYGTQIGTRIPFQCIDLATQLAAATAQATAAQQMRDQTQAIISGAGDAGTLVALAQPTGASLVGLPQGGNMQNAIMYYTPEMFGAGGKGLTDDTAAIVNAMTAARNSGVNEVCGFGIYKVSSTMKLYSGVHDSPSGLSSRFGFKIYLNTIIVDSANWPALPDTWWEAAPVFQPAAGCEGCVIRCENFDGGGKATFLNTVGGSLGTSHVHVTEARNHILVYRNYMNVAGQGTMNLITGGNWQDGYQGVLLGSGVGGANSECHMVDVFWLANHRYGGIMLQDRTQYSHVKGGTVDFNGRYMSCIELTNISANTGFEVAYGNPITNGTITRYAMSSIMNNDGKKILMIAETTDRSNGTSDFVVGDTLSYNGWSATVASVETCNDTTHNFFDIVVSNRSGDFSKCVIMPTYLGGWKGHNKFTNFAICNNSTETIGSFNLRGLGIDGGVNSSFWYLNHLYGGNAVFGFYNNNMTINQPVELGNNALWGYKGAYAVTPGVTINAITYPAVSDETKAAYYNLVVGSSQAGQFARAVIRVGVSAITIMEVTEYKLMTLATDGLNLQATVFGADAIITFSTMRII